MAKEGALKKGLCPKKARYILWALSGRDLYSMLVAEQKWAADESESWLSRLLTKELVRTS